MGGNLKQDGLSGSTLKMVAVITMLIDHFAAAVLVRHFYATGDYSLYMLYFVMRQIGRTAFPIYCFFLVEGIQKTHNPYSYLGRMVLLAFISEIPFDLAFHSTILEFTYQNVFFTLAIGLAAMAFMEQADKKPWRKEVVWALRIAVTVVSILLAELLRTDYGGCGVACILLLYFLRRHRRVSLLAGYLAFVVLIKEVEALPAFLLLALYRGKKGHSRKLFFYGFYPIHLIVLYAICVLLGIHVFPAV